MNLEPWGYLKIRLFVGAAMMVLTVVVVMLATAGGRRWLRHIDSILLGERLTDTVARMRVAEDWASAASLRADQDYSWLAAVGRPVRIAHALGESGSPSANTLASARRAYQAGFRLLEVDLVLERGKLLCQHDPGPQIDLVKDGCTFETLLATLPRDAWIVLDIKSNFEATGQLIVDRIKGSAEAKRVVFQLYQPSDFALFNRWQSKVALPGPILTVYRSHHSVDNIARQAPRLGIEGFALPMERLPALSARPVGAKVLVHPVHDCEDWAKSVMKADGLYTLSALQCSRPPEKQ